MTNQEKKTDESRREYRRLSINLKGSYRIFESGLPFAVMTVVNLSRTGICFQCDSKLKPETLLELRVRLPKQPEVRMLAKVIWSNRFAEEETFRCGVRLLDTRRDDAQLFIRFYNYHLLYPPNEQHVLG